MYTFKIRVQIFFGTDEAALAAHRRLRGKEFKKEILGDILSVFSDFLGALAAIGVFKKSHKRKHRRYAERILRQLEKYVDAGAINCVHMVLLVRAEMMTLKVRSSAETQRNIRRSFDKAISVASRNGIYHHAALANERAASYYSTLDAEYANFYRRKAFEWCVE